MSEQATEDKPGEVEVAELPPTGDSSFSSLVDALAAAEDSAAAGEGGAAADAAAAPDGPAAPEAEGAGEEKPPVDQQPAGADGKPGVPSDAGTGKTGEPAAADPAATAGADGGDAAKPDADVPTGASQRPAEWTVDATDLIPRLGEISTKLEERVETGFRETAMADVRKEYEKYFEAVEKHPRLLVGTEVPAIGKEGTETLRDSEDAKEWQEAIKSILAQEVQARAAKSMEDNGDYLDTLHASIELFQNNADLVPGSKQFDVDLANRLVQIIQPYEVRVEGKLHGYTIPVQPIVNQLRTALTEERAKTPAATSPVAGDTAGAAKDAAPADPPQAGIRSKPGSSTEKEDFSTLWGTLGLPNMQL